MYRKMYLKATIMVLIISLLACGTVYSEDLVWSEEFDTVSPVLDGNRPNPDTWAYDCGGWGFGNGQLEYCTARIENSYIENGNLVLVALREFYQEATANEFTSARMLTQGRFAFKYGTLEARIKLPDTANGLWPAFWMMGINFPGIDWAMCGELDIAEIGSKAGIDEGLQNKKINCALHYDNDGHVCEDAWLDATVDLSLDYHLYKVEWTPTQMTFYLDGVPFGSFDITADYLREFHQPTFVVINIAIGSWPSGYVGIYDPAAITAPFPAKMYVDWIRLYSNPSTEIYLGRESEESGNSGFGIFTETTPVDNSLVYGDDTDPNWNYGTEAGLYIWNNMTEATPPTPSEGSECWSFNINPGTWYGMGVFLPNYRNMKNYSNGYLHFDMVTTTTDNIKIGLKSSVGDEAWVLLEEGVEDFGLVRDGEWHEVSVPLNRFTNIDFQTVHQMFMMAGDPTMATNISLDDIWWEPSAPKQAPENGNFGVYTETAANKDAGEFVLDTDGGFYIWEKTLVDGTQTPYEGSESISLKSAGGLTWFGCAFTPNMKYNLSAFGYPESRLHFALKTSSSTTFWLGMKSGNVSGMGQKWITFKSGSDPYGFARDGQWHVIDIPMSDFTTDVDLCEVSQFFQILGTTGGISDIEFDDICFTGGGTASECAGVCEGCNIPPTVSITSPVSGTFFDPGDNVTIEADANDSDGWVTKVEFFEGVNLLGEDPCSPYSYTWNSIPEGAYTFRAKATDNNDVSRTSSPITIYVGTPELTTIGVSPSITSVEEGKVKQFTGRGFDQFGLEFPLPGGVNWSVSGGGVIDENGFFAAVDLGGPYTVTAVEAVNGVLSGTASVSVFAGGLCTGEPANGDYTWEATGVNPTVTFIPSGPGIGNTLLIFYYSKSPEGVFPGYITSPGVPFPITGATPGETIYFYYTYNTPGGEHTTMYDKHSFQVGNCPPIIASDFDGNGRVNLSDFARLAMYWMETNCDVSNDYCEGADHVRDSDVDIYDLHVLVYSWLKGSGGPGVPPSVSITSPANGASFSPGSNVTITANAADADGTITKVEFFQGATKLGEDTTAPYSYTWNSVPESTYILTAVATDNEALSTTSASITIYVETPTMYPSVSITSPVDGSAFDPGDNVTIEADAADADGWVTKVEFLEGVNLLGEDLSSPYSFTWNSVPVGTYVLTAKATDSNGLSSISAPVTIYVGTGPIVANGGFESGVGVAATGWIQNQFAPGTTLERKAESPHSGDYSMKFGINWTGGAGPKAELLQTTAVGSIPGSMLVNFSFWYKGTLGVSEQASANIKWLNAAGTEIGGTAWYGFTPTGNYQQFSQTGLSGPALTSRAKVTIQLVGGTMAQTGTIYIDDVRLY